MPLASLPKNHFTIYRSDTPMTHQKMAVGIRGMQ